MIYTVVNSCFPAKCFSDTLPSLIFCFIMVYHRMFFFNWKIIALRRCVSFWYTTMWISYKYTYIHSLLSIPPELHLSSLVPLNEVHFFRNVQGLCSNFMSVVKYLLLRGFPWLPYLKQAFLSITLHFLTFSFFLSLFVYLLLAVLGLHCCARALSSCGKWGLLSRCWAQTSHGGGFSCRGAPALGHAGFSRWGS